MFLRKMGTACNDPLFIPWLEKLIGEGFERAKGRLVTCFKNDFLIQKDYEGAVIRCHKYAEQGEVWAQQCLGSFWYALEGRSGASGSHVNEGSTRSVPHRDKSRTISAKAVKFASELFREDAFSEENRESDIVNYLVDLADDVRDIRERRNPAAHADVMSIEEAELCGDYLIKERRVLYNFLDKIKPECKNRV